MKRWWCRWYEGNDDETHPTTDGLLGIWVSGVCADGSYAVMCALVEAETQGEAEALIEGIAINFREWSFCDEKPADWTPGDRFPMEDRQ